MVTTVPSGPKEKRNSPGSQTKLSVRLPVKQTPPLKTVASKEDIKPVKTIGSKEDVNLKTISSKEELKPIRTIASKEEVKTMRTIASKEDVRATRTIGSKEDVRAMRTMGSKEDVRAMRTIGSKEEVRDMKKEKKEKSVYCNLPGTSTNKPVSNEKSSYMISPNETAKTDEKTMSITLPAGESGTDLTKQGAEMTAPITHCKIVTNYIKLLSERDLEIIFSYNLVVRYVPRSSPAVELLLIGDEVVEVNDVAVFTAKEITRQLEIGPSRAKVTVVRAWNVNSVGSERLPISRRLDGYYYLLVEMNKIKDFQTGFDLKISNKQHVVSVIKPNSQAALTFYKGDRILEMNGRWLSGTTLKEVRRMFTEDFNTLRKSCFLVERQITLRSSPNPSCIASKNPAELEMGDDSVEIGCREATKLGYMKYKLFPRSIYRIARPKIPKAEDRTQDGVCITTTDDEGTAPTVLKKKGSKKKKLYSAINFDGKNEVMRMPSDVKDESKLQKVTAKSGIIGYVRSYLRG